jgi:hypothetical protein
MKLVLGFKAHSGWAAMVALGGTPPARDGNSGQRLIVFERRRVELSDPADGEWSRQPYHAAERLPAARARDVVARGVETARGMALQEIQSAVARAKAARHAVAGCAVLIGTPMPAWTVDEILAVHLRMHQAEGALFRGVLIDAARACNLAVVEPFEKRIGVEAERALSLSEDRLNELLSSLKTQVGPPWGKDQKDAALAAMIGLKGM